MRLSIPLSAAVSVLVYSAAVTAQEPQSSLSENRTLDIHALIARVADEIDKEIIVDPRVPPSGAAAGYSTEENTDYETLLAILRISGFIAIDTADQILIVPEQNARAEPTRILNEDDPRVSDHEVVTRIIEIPVIPDTRTPQQVAAQIAASPFQSGPPSMATQLVPILRPMMPQHGQMGVVSGTNKIVIVDRYDNVRRITAVIEELAEGLGD